jgi:hypothetical protein
MNKNPTNGLVAGEKQTKHNNYSRKRTKFVQTLFMAANTGQCLQ